MSTAITKQEFKEACLYLLDTRPLVYGWLPVKELASLVHEYGSSELLFENAIIRRTHQTSHLASWIRKSESPEVGKWRSAVLKILPYDDPQESLDIALRYFPLCQCLRPKCFYIRSRSSHGYGEYCNCAWSLKPGQLDIR